MNENKILQVGDVLLSKGNYGTYSVVNVVRVTPTQAILSDGDKLKREHRDGQSCIGARGWSSTHYYFDTPERRAEKDHYHNCEYLKKYLVEVPKNNYGKVLLSYEVVAQIVAIHKAAMVKISEIIKSESK